MNNELMIAILAGLGGMLGWGFADFFAKKSVDVVGATKSLVWAQTFGTVLFILIAAGQVVIFDNELVMPDDVNSWLWLAFFGVLQMVVYWFAYRGFEKGQLAVLNPVFASYSGIVALLAVLFFGDNLTAALTVALTAIFLGNMLLNVDLKALRSKRLKITPGLQEIIIAAILAAVWTLGWDQFITGRDALSSALVMFTFMSIAAYVLSRIMGVRLSGVKPSLWKFLVLMGAGEVTAYLAISWGFSSTPYTGLIALISGAFSVPAVLLAYWFLKERVTKLQVVAILIIVCGIILVPLTL